MTASSTYVFAGGGSGGHLFPGIAIADELKGRDARTRIVFVGSSRAIESAIVSAHGLEHQIIPVEPLATLSRNPLRFAFRNWQACRAAARLLKALAPTAVIGLGGIASAPIVWAASRSRIPIILLEQNVIPGRMTRWLSPLADRVCISFDATRSQLPRARHVIVTGNAIRKEIADLHCRDHVSSGSFDSSTRSPELLILGGSQGADSLNEAVLGAIQQLRGTVSKWKIFHQTGPRQSDRMSMFYQGLNLQSVVEPFFDDLPDRYSTVDLVISRAGATTLAELACAGVAMILLPYPQAADNHQSANAEVFVNHKAAFMVEHAKTVEETVPELVRVLDRLMGNNEERFKMGFAAKQLAHPDATQKIANVIRSVVEQD